MSDVIASLFMLAITAADPVVMVREPVPAEYWRQSVTFRCGRDVLEIAGYGPSRPAGRPVRIMLNGRRPSGDKLPELVRDLSRVRAVYRITGLCNQRSPGISVVYVSGENVGDGVVTYNSAAAYFKDGRLRTYTGLSPDSAEGFWFR